MITTTRSFGSVTVNVGQILIKSTSVFAAWLLIVASLPAHGADTTGFIRFNSCTFMEQLRLELISYRGRKLGRTIILRIPGYLPPETG